MCRGLLYFNRPGFLVRSSERRTGDEGLQGESSCSSSSREEEMSPWAYKEGDRVGIYVDLQRGKLAFFLNGLQVTLVHVDPELASCPEFLFPTVVLIPLFDELYIMN